MLRMSEMESGREWWARAWGRDALEKHVRRRLLGHSHGNAEFAHADFLDLHALRFPAIKRACSRPKFVVPRVGEAYYARE